MVTQTCSRIGFMSKLIYKLNILKKNRNLDDLEPYLVLCVHHDFFPL